MTEGQPPDTDYSSLPRYAGSDNLGPDPSDNRGERGWQNSRHFDVLPDGSPPHDPRHVATHSRIVRTGEVCGTVAAGAVLALMVMAGRKAWLDHGWGWSLARYAVAAPLAPAAWLPGYYYGVGVALLFAPGDFLRGPIGAKWLRLAGVRTPGAARLLALLLLLGSAAIALPILYLLLRRAW